MKPADSLIEITPDELACILQSRQARGLTANHPAQVDLLLHPDSREIDLRSEELLWYVTEMILIAQDAKRMKQADKAAKWRAKAQVMAAEVARIVALELAELPADNEFARKASVDLLHGIAAAIQGRRIPEKPETTTGLILGLIFEFHAYIGKRPTQTELKTYAKQQGINVRHADVSLVFNKWNDGSDEVDRLPSGKRGRKPKN
jgi:hypothetical protein